MKKKETQPEIELGLHIIEKTFSQKIEETKAKIFRAAKHILRKKGYEELSIKNINIYDCFKIVVQEDKFFLI